MAALGDIGRRLWMLARRHDALGWRWLDDLVQDLRYAVRSLATHKGFAATVLSTLALGIGATTAIFSVVNGVVLRPLPFPQSDRLVQLYETSPLFPQGQGFSNIDVFRTESTSFDAIAGYQVSARYLRRPEGSTRVMTVGADRDFFSVLGVAPIGAQST